MSGFFAFLPCLVLIASIAVEIEPSILFTLFIVSLALAAFAFYHSEDENMNEYGTALSFFCILGAGYYVFKVDDVLNPETAFVLYASVMNFVGAMRRMPKK